MSEHLMVLSCVLCFALASGLACMAVEGEPEQVKNRPVAIDASFSTPGRMMVVSLFGHGGQGSLRLEIVNQPENGRVEVRDRLGQVKYSPKAGFSGIDIFLYQFVDERGVASEPATVTIKVLPRGSVDYASGIRFDPPPYLEETGATQNRLFKLGYLDVTWYDGWKGNPVDPTGERFHHRSSESH